VIHQEYSGISMPKIVWIAHSQPGGLTSSLHGPLDHPLGDNIRGRDQAAGRWGGIMSILAPELEFALTISPGILGLRYHSSLAYFSEEGQNQGRYPGLVGMLTDSQGQAVTLHRIYLTQDGRKAPVAYPKKTMPYPSDRNLTGAAVRLGPVADLLGISEGIETALAVTQATGMVCWATTSAILLAKIVLPAEVKRVVVWGDNDTTKERAGQNAALRHT